MNKGHGSSDFWDDYTRDFDAIYTHEKSGFHNLLDRIFRQDMYERFQFTLDHSQPISNKSVLDVGCGPGYYSLAYAREGAKRVVGIDYSKRMIELANEYLQKEALDGSCRFLVRDIMDFDTEMRFDISIAIGLFDYIEDPLPVLNKMRMLTRERMILSFPRMYTWRAPVRKFRLMMKNLDVYFYSKSRLTSILESADLKRYEIIKVGKLHFVVVFLE